MKKEIWIGVVIIGLLLVAVACADTEAVELARMRRADAEARQLSASAQGTVNVIQAETDAHIQKMRAETDITKEIRQFDADMAREDFAVALLEVQALQIALRETREIVAPLEYNARAAANNSWWLLIFMPIGVVVILMGVAGLAWNMITGLEERLARIEKSVSIQEVDG